ncbi:hypothetical protein ACI3PL_10990, partial [Lacticaseibacillus paracasei]
ESCTKNVPIHENHRLVWSLLFLIVGFFSEDVNTEAGRLLQVVSSFQSMKATLFSKKRRLACQYFENFFN